MCKNYYADLIYLNIDFYKIFYYYAVISLILDVLFLRRIWLEFSKQKTVLHVFT